MTPTSTVRVAANRRFGFAPPAPSLLMNRETGQDQVISRSDLDVYVRRNELEIERPCARVLESEFFRCKKRGVYVIDFSAVSPFSGAAVRIVQGRARVIKSGFKDFHASKNRRSDERRCRQLRGCSAPQGAGL